MFKIPFSGNSKVIDLVQVTGLQRLVDFTNHIPNRIMSPVHSRPNHTKDALYSTGAWGKESKYFASFRSVKS
jgi:hypothetical protein